MAQRPLKPCAERGCPALTRSGSRCQAHVRAHAIKRASSTARGYDRQWRGVAAQAIREQPWCTDCLHPGSPDNPLTGDHIIPLSQGGQSIRSNCVVRCRRCNSKRGNRPAGGG